MKQIGICGNFGRQKESGQTVKTNMFFREVSDICETATFDTYGINRRTPWKIVGFFRFVAGCENVVIMPAQNGLRMLVPLLRFLHFFLHRKLWYVVIGGWLPEYCEKHHLLCRMLRKFDGIFVETASMQNTLRQIGFQNVSVMPNFKNLKKTATVRDQANTPFKLCTFSRVTEKKGIDEAVETVKLLTKRQIAVRLDIFGAVQEDYRARLDELIKTENVAYRGIINSQHTVEVLEEYDALFFPTYYEGEGFPGTILDAYFAGLPIIASDWKYNAEIVKDSVNGFLVKVHDINGYAEKIECLVNNKEIWRQMRYRNLSAAELYEPKKIVREVLLRMGISAS